MTPDPPGSRDRAQAFEIPERIGPYRIVETIGEGGMGVVYRAEQSEPVRREVALKVIKLGMDTKEVVARFDSERQALAVMEHPNIARVLDAGATDVGRPYFVMELVRGIRLDRYCDQAQLSNRERIELMIAVCAAVQHAHQKGVIHRDLKPSNVLVTEVDGRPVPKIIDFGIAKATGLRLSNHTVVTTYGQAIGTLAYMSPEQAETSGLDIDTRADVYSLGVILYELAAGRVPLDPQSFGGAGFIAQLIHRDHTLPTPLEKLTSLDEPTVQRIVTNRRTTRADLRRELAGDLQWIVLKAMEKDRARRYESASGLAADLRRYLDNDTVTARRPTTWYRMEKFVRRHRVGVVSTAVIFALLALFAATVSIQAARIASERDRAESEASRAQAAKTFLEETLLAPDPLDGMGRNVTVVERLDAAVTDLDDAFTGQPEIDATVRAAIGWAYFRLGRYDDAEPLIRGALEMQRAAFGEEHADVAESLYRLGELFLVRADFDSATAVTSQALEIRRRANGPSHPVVAATLGALARTYSARGDFDAAEEALSGAISIERALGPERVNLAELLDELGGVHWNRGDYEPAEEAWRDALRIRRRLLGDEHPLVAESLNNLAVLLDNMGNVAEAEPLYREALALQRELLGGDHEEVAAISANLAILLDGQGKYEEAEALYREALAIDLEQFGDAHPAVAGDRVNLASFLCTLTPSQEGLRLAAAGWDGLRHELESDHWMVANARQWYAYCLSRLERFTEAEPEFLGALADIEDALGAENYRVLRLRQRIADFYEAWGRPDVAAEYRR